MGAVVDVATECFPLVGEETAVRLGADDDALPLAESFFDLLGYSLSFVWEA